MKGMKQWKMKLAKSAMLLMIAGSSFAQGPVTPDSIRELESVEVYKAKTYVPLTFQNMSLAELKKRYIGQEPSFLLIETPSVTNYSDAGNSQGYSYFRLRGIDQTRINVTLDGVPMNEPEDQGAYFSNYPDLWNSVSSIQIQRGASTTMNGVASFAGSIQLFSPDLSDSSYRRVGGGFGSYNSFRVYGEYNSGIVKNKALYIRASEVYSNGYKYHSSNNGQSVLLSAGLFREKAVWKVKGLIGQQRNGLAWIGVTDSLIQIDPRTNANSPYEKDRFLQGLIQLQNAWKLRPNSVLSTSFYSTFQNGYYTFDINNFIGLPSTNALFKYGFLSQMYGIYSNYALVKSHLNWVTGINASTYNRQHTGSDDQSGIVYRNTGYKNEFSAFSKVNYTHKKWVLFADIQYRFVFFDYRGAVPFNALHWQFLSPKAGVNRKLNRLSSLYYSISYTGREPIRNDMFGGNDDLLADIMGNALLSNTNPEFVTDHELGYRLRKSKWQMTINWYYMDFKNEIVLNGKFGPNGLLLTENVDKSYRTGFELSASYQWLSGIFLSNNSSFNHSEIRENNQSFKPILTPAWIINQELGYRYKAWIFAISGRFQDASFIDFTNANQVKSYVLMNARVHYEWKNLDVTLFVNNLTNTKYRNQGYVDFDGRSKYFVQARANAYLALNYRF